MCIISTLDEKMRFCGCRVIHDGFEMTRLQKVKNITQFKEKENIDIKLRVCCTERGEETNCCKCEKCYRTIGELISLKKNLKEFGFDISEKEIKKDMKQFFKKQELPATSIRHWKEIQLEMLSDKRYFKKLKYAKWIMKFNFDNVNKKDFKKEIWNENNERI